MKMDNVLFNTATRNVAIIDLGECKPFVRGKNPWSRRVFPYFFAYPPDFNSIEGYETYTNYFYNADPGQLDYMKSIGYFTYWATHDDVGNVLKSVWYDYFRGPYDAKRTLWVGVTADLYGLGITLRYSIRSLSVKDMDRPVYVCGYNPDGTEIIKSTGEIVEVLEFLLCHVHPRMRPLDYTIVKYFNTLNPDKITYAPKTKIRVGGVDYADISIFQGLIPSIDMPTGMAYGTADSPITKEDLRENMLVFAFLMLKAKDRLIEYFNEKAYGSYVNMKYTKVLEDAKKRFESDRFKGIPNFVKLGIVIDTTVPSVASPGFSVSTTSLNSSAPGNENIDPSIYNLYTKGGRRYKTRKVKGGRLATMKMATNIGSNLNLRSNSTLKNKNGAAGESDDSWEDASFVDEDDSFGEKFDKPQK
jgi:hypothetical protein